MGKYKDTLRTEKKEFRVTEEESAQIVKHAKEELLRVANG